MIKDNEIILAKGQYYSMDCYQTQLNNNVVVVGTSGSGKTRSIVSPNILQAYGSYIISDPKGNLHKKYRRYLEDRGYVVKVLDFIHPEKSDHFNFFKYIRTEQDILKVANMITYCDDTKGCNNIDPFWNQSAEIFLCSLISFLRERKKTDEMNLNSLHKLVVTATASENNADSETILDRVMDAHHRDHPDSFAYRQYMKIRTAPPRTWNCILATLEAKLGKYDSSALQKMMAYDNMNLQNIGNRKTAIFVVVSDIDRSLDGLANIFYSQTLDVLCRYADEKCKDNRLPIDVRFILDDFATNCKIQGFPCIISNIRSRGISAMIMIQAESQLRAGYQEDARTILANCDTYVYLGGNDVETAKEVAKRCDLPYRKILNMPVGTNWIFRRGQEPIHGENFELQNYMHLKQKAEDVGQEIA